MNRYLSFLIFSLFASNVSYAQDSEPSPKDYKPNLIIDRGIQLSSGTISSKNRWQGLYCNDKDCEIKNIRIKVGKQFVEHLDENNKVPLDVIKVPGNPLVLLNNQNFKLGKTTTFYKYQSKPDDSVVPKTSQYNDLRNGKWVMPWGKQPLTFFWSKIDNQDESDYRNYQISDGIKTQSLFKIYALSKYEGETVPIVYWVGDLDNDEKIDMILEIPDDNCGFDYRLYLSSKANKNEILKESSRFTGFQDACGC